MSSVQLSVATTTSSSVTGAPEPPRRRWNVPLQPPVFSPSRLVGTVLADEEGPEGGVGGVPYADLLAELRQTKEQLEELYAIVSNNTNN